MTKLRWILQNGYLRCTEKQRFAMGITFLLSVFLIMPMRID
nr:MAG TPA: hypothetical protein [Caudoviricetes sp.]